MRYIDDYKCQECGKVKEVLTHRGELVRCECGGKMERQIGCPAVKVYGGYSEKMTK